MRFVRLTRDQAGKGLPVAFEATVTYYIKNQIDLFVQDGDDAVYVEAKTNENLVPGDRVLVRGKTRASFSVDVLGENITLLHHGAPPDPVQASFASLIRAQLDCMRVTVRATVRSADTVNFGTMHGTYLRLLMDGGTVDAIVGETGTGKLDDLLDSDVEVTGVVSGKFDSKMQLTGILLEVPLLSGVKVLKAAGASLDALPFTPMDQVLSGSFAHDQSTRVRVRGSITYYQPGYAVVLQNGSESLWISTRSSIPLRVGDVAVATGFPDARQGFLALDDGHIQDTNIYDPIPPQPSTWRQLSTWNSGDPDGHQNDLVSFEGKVVTAVREGSQDEFVLDSDGKLFTAIYRHPSNRRLRPMLHISPGSGVRVTGICMIVQGDSVDPTEKEVPFNILLRSLDDVAVVAPPSMLNIRNLLLLAGILLVLLFVAGARSWIMERKIRQQNAKVALVERRRSRILEDINASRPLNEILEKITELVSFKLGGAPCWCQISDEPYVGNCPSGLAAFRVLDAPITSRTGQSIGSIFAAFDPLTTPRDYEAETVSTAASQAKLAIETRHIYTELTHRSEYDLLTDVHNRFALDRQFGQAIDAARHTESLVGLVYLDLNDFKLVNDQYGHRVGDLYLQEVAARMKRQLRAADILARLGGDEFAVLLPDVRKRNEVEEIAVRLERCLDEPFYLEGHSIFGSASIGIAVYPEDGSTKASVLSAADAAMYVNKHIRRESRTDPRFGA